MKVYVFQLKFALESSLVIVVTEKQTKKKND